jgi:hypothetical protein
MVPKQHPGTTTTFEHLKSHKMPTTTHMLSDLAIAPTMQAIVVNCVAIVDPQLAPIIRHNAEIIMASPENSHAASPAHSKVVASGKARPLASCIAIVHYLAPASHVRFTCQSLAPAALTKVEHIFHEEAVTISDGIRHMPPA